MALISGESVPLLPLHHLATNRLDHLVAGNLKTVRSAFGEVVCSGDMDLDFRNLVRVFRIPLEPEEHFAGNQLVVKGRELRESPLNEIQQLAIGIKMDGVNLHLHGMNGLRLPPWT